MKRAWLGSAEWHAFVREMIKIHDSHCNFICGLFFFLFPRPFSLLSVWSHLHREFFMGRVFLAYLAIYSGPRMALSVLYLWDFSLILSFILLSSILARAVGGERKKMYRRENVLGIFFFHIIKDLSRITELLNSTLVFVVTLLSFFLFPIYSNLSHCI